VVAHIAAGNVFVGACDSLAMGLLTKNACILKISSADSLFPLLFAESLKAADPEGVVADSVAVVYFPGGDKAVEQALKNKVDGIVLWGGLEAVKSYQTDLPPSCRLIAYGPKYSFAVITKDGLNTRPLDEICAKTARDVILWEQRACSSPHAVYLEEGIQVAPFLEALSRQLDAAAKELPQGALSTDEKVEITKAREMARMSSALSEGMLSHSKDTSWTVIFEKDPSFRISPLNRVLFLKSFRNREHLQEVFQGLSFYQQTVGLLAQGQEYLELSRILVGLGATRITELGRMSTGMVGAPHDGSYELANLVRWTTIEATPDALERPGRLFQLKAPEVPVDWDRVQLMALSNLAFQRVRELFERAKAKAPFYRERFESHELRDWRDFRKLPLMDKQDIYENAPPLSEALLTAPLARAYIFGSGGTTGAPKFTCYLHHELSLTTDALALLYRVAGIERDDIVGNLFMAGNLWTSFIAVNKALETIGCVNLPIAGNIDIDLIVYYLQLFKANAVIGMPSILTQMAEYVEENRTKGFKLEKILYGGEHLAPDVRQYLAKVTGAQIILSAGYASVDAGPIGFQCRHVKGTVHHVLQDHQLVEILHPETEVPSPPGQAGEIVATNLVRKLMPIIRYRTGDLGRWVEDECPCGRPTPLFELLGRCDDMVRVGTVDIYPDGLAAIFSKEASLSHIFQIVASKDSLKDQLLIKIEVKDPEVLSDSQELASRLESELLSENFELRQALEEGWLGSLKVRLAGPGEILRNKRTGKIRKVLDLRT
ncbi:MAG: AMP-binding protein, partial [Armatimonadetes bacterium]|nr:AMP-binding protein [Armatimonadota bacterium]